MKKNMCLIKNLVGRIKNTFYKKLTIAYRCCIIIITLTENRMKESFDIIDIIDIAWPSIIKYTKEAGNQYPFKELSKYFKENGYVWDYESETMILQILGRTAEAIRTRAFGSEVYNQEEKSLDVCCAFAKEIMQNLANAFKVDLPSQETFKNDFETYINDRIMERKDFMNNLEEESDFYKRTFSDAKNYLNFISNPQRSIKQILKLPDEEIFLIVNNPGMDFGRYYGPIGDFVIHQTYDIFRGFENGITPSQVIKTFELVDNIDYIAGIFNNIKILVKFMEEKKTQFELSKYLENIPFINDCKRLISCLGPHDRYHGTTYDTLNDILIHGLYMVQNNLDSTSYKINRFVYKNKEELLKAFLLFRNGMEQSRGEGVVLFSEDAKIEELTDEEKRNVKVCYSMSGPLGVEYKISPKYIIGVIDTINQKVTFGPMFEKLINAEKDL